MPVLSEAQIEEALQPFLSPVSPELVQQLSVYLDLLVRWNERTNLTAVRSPEEMVRRHFGESLFAGLHLGKPLPDTLLDLGSGAGFPGMPIALQHPSVKVTLAESQNKKATFLREVVRTLGLSNVEVWGGRAEALPATRTFHTVTLRAVDNMAAALEAAMPRAAHQILLLATDPPAISQGFRLVEKIPVPESSNSFVLRLLRDDVPRGTLQVASKL
ncbi:MAG TPA: 16S rRNA (guanine(527)-N(7))-methyltransferase RsmG [Edaphobacter sp.]|nr:16S rRNA (guanine(527)-N(7))-methyltransferase RsmG [Edaphobacter sp.]